MDCGNCDQNFPEKAEFYYTTEKGVMMGLCGQCRGAFELGQVNPNAKIKRVRVVLRRRSPKPR
jgi:hypothetical protein